MGFTWLDLATGLFECVWCGSAEDKEHIVEHVENCQREIAWLNEHVAEAK